MECGTESEPVPPSRSISPSPSVAAIGKVLPAPAAAFVLASRLGLGGPIDVPNLPAGLRPPLRN
jgi:hypothetical protein